MAKEILYKKLLPDDSSFQLVRTNPKLTGNVKLTVTGDDKVFLTSINANEELAKDRYKKFNIDTRFSHTTNIHRFFNSGATPPELIFDLNEEVDTSKTSTDYKDQYDFSHYFSGVRYLVNTEFEEQFSYFAPLYLNKVIPDYFIIFRLENPMNFTSSESRDNFPFEKDQYLEDMFKNASIIDTFDLTEDTQVGAYIRNYYNDPQFPKSPLSVRFEDDLLTTWNGISVKAGSFAEKGEQLHDFYQEAWPIKYVEEILTLGYERNNIIFPNILNLEFAFDDEEAELYDFNRYVGFFVNKVQLGKMNVDLERLRSDRRNKTLLDSEKNSPFLKKDYDPDTDDVILTQTNDDGVIIPFKNSEVKLSEFTNFLTKDSLFFNYIDDKDENFYLPKPSDPYTIETEDGIELDRFKIRLSNKSIDLGKFFGPNDIFVQDEGKASRFRGFSFMNMRVLSEFTHLDQIKFYHPNGSQKDSDGCFDILLGVKDYIKAPGPTDCYFYHDKDNIVGHDKYYFNCTGTPEEIAEAITTCIDSIRYKKFNAIQYDDRVFIKSRVAGDNLDSQFKLQFIAFDENSGANYDVIEIDTNTGQEALENVKFDFVGGSAIEGNRLILDDEHRTKLEENINNIVVRTTQGWSRIAKISKNMDPITEDNARINKENSLDEFLNTIAIVLEKKETPAIQFGEAVFKDIFTTNFGLISFFPIKDLDFDFYSSLYLNFPINDLYSIYYIPENLELLTSGNVYLVRGTGTIEIGGDQYSGGEEFTVSSTSSYTVISGDPIVTLTNEVNDIGDSLTTPINDENEEFKIFPGFFTMKDPDKVVSQEDNGFFEFRDKYLNGLANTEYDFNKENFTKDFSQRSKMIPYINKWSLTGGKDVRDNPYRLSTDLAFGFNNFTPSHTETSQNPANFTHEWFYIQSIFNKLQDKQIEIDNNSYFDEFFDEDKLISDEDYFLDYFTYTPVNNGLEVGPTQHRYSTVRFDEIEQAQVFFKGFSVLFKDIQNTNVNGPDGKPLTKNNSKRFTDYRFSVILKPIKEVINDDTQQPIKYKVIEHKTFKFIVIVIELYLGDAEANNIYWATRQGPTSPGLDIVDASNFLDTSVFGSPNYDSINGDYRFNFEIVSGGEMTELNYVKLYSMKHKKVNTDLDNFSNVKFSFKLNPSTSGTFIGGTNTIEILDNLNIPNYPFIAQDELTGTDERNFVILRDKQLGADTFIDVKSGFNPLNESPINGAKQKSFTLSQTNDVVIINLDNLITSNIPSVIPADLFQTNFMVKQVAGGLSFYEKLFQRISFAAFKGYVNELNPIVEYSTYELSDGSPVQVTNQPFFLEIEDNRTITKTQILTTEVDEEKPAQFAFTDVIGFNFFQTPVTEFEIVRYDGGFSPVCRELIQHKSIFNFTTNDFEPIKIGNVEFNASLPNFSTLVNFSHIKISDNKILDLENDDKFEPQYPLLNELATNQQDYFLMTSNWEHGFHYNYLNKADFTEVAGSLRVEEDSSFVGKVITLPSLVELENFQVTTLGENDELDDVNIEDIELVVKEGKFEINGIINLENIIARYFIDNNISRKFDEFLENDEEFIGNFTSIEEYVDAYIRANLLQLYQINSVEFFTKFDKALTSNLEQTRLKNTLRFEFLDDKNRELQNFELNRSLQINKRERLILRYSFQKELKGSLVVSPKIKINFI